jgi:hypothetical protein
MLVLLDRAKGVQEAHQRAPWTGSSAGHVRAEVTSEDRSAACSGGSFPDIAFI